MAQDAYRRLQQALDAHPVGLRAADNGSDIAVLRHIFTPEEAEIVSRMDWHFHTLQEIHERVSDLAGSREELSTILREIVRKGGLSYRRRDEEQWAIAPLVVGMYEYQVGRMTRGFVRDLQRYWMSPKSGPPPPERPGQMRVIPVGESIRTEHRIATHEDVSAMIDTAGESIALLECVCRKKTSMTGHTCERTSRAESCMAFLDFAEQAIEQGDGRRITRDEARGTLRQSLEEGLVLMPSNSQTAQFVCSCCPDCCGVLTALTYEKTPARVALNNFQARVNADECIGCGSCEEICPIDAVKVREDVAAVDPERCIGCGVCVVRCEPGAIQLARKPEQTTPPETLDDLYTQYDSLRRAPE